MTDERNPSARGSDAGNPTRASHFLRRRRIRLGIIVAAVVALLILVFSYVPGYVARHLLASTVAKEGIDLEGLETLQINPWTRELWLGPVRFGIGPSNPGQLGELGLRLRVAPLLERKVSIDRLLLRGIDVTVIRDGEDAVHLNGIPLHRFIPPPSAAGTPEESGEGWAAGVDTLELRDSRLHFRDRDGSELEVEVDRLALMGFKTWEPERPGRFELAARLNDIRLNWTGEARPFADSITLAIDSRTEQADLPKLVRLTGPLGLDRHAGTFDAHLKHSLTLPASGGLDGQAAGTIAIAGVDYGRSEHFALALERAQVSLDVRYTFSESGDFSLQGEVAADLGPIRTSFSDTTQVSAAGGRVAMTGLDSRYLTEVSLDVAGKPSVELEGIGLSGPIEISVETLLEPLVLLQSLTATQAVSSADTGLGGFSGRSLALGASDTNIDRLTADAENFRLQSIEGRVELGLTASIDLSDTDISANQRRLTIERWKGLLDSLRLASGQGQLEVSATGSSSLAAGTASGPRGEMGIDELGAEIDQLELQAKTGAIALRLATVGRAKGFSGLAHAKELRPEVKLNVGAVQATLSQASIDAQGGLLRWQASGDASAESLSAAFAKGQAGTLRLARAEVKALEASEPSRFAAETFVVEGLDVALTRSLFLPLFRDGGAATEKAAAPREAAAKVDVAEVQRLLLERGHDPGPVDGQMGPKTARAIEAFQRQGGLNVDGRLSPSLLTALQARETEPVGSTIVQTPQQGIAKARGAALRLGRIAIAGDPVVRFRDDLITPNVKIDSVIRKFLIEDLDTENTDQRTQLTLIGQVDERTDVELVGWVSGSMENADLDVTAKVANLHLPTYSPYFAEFYGVHLESGRLDTTTKVKAAQGNLQGEIQLSLADTGLRPSSKANARRVTEEVGIPLEMAVDLLKDVDGRIALSLPITGRVSKPDVDFGPAIDKAIGNVLKTAFPPTLIASMLASLADSSGPPFVSIEFSPASAELNQGGKSSADSLAKLLSEHPELSLKLCGRFTARDRNAVTSAAKIHSRQEANAKGLSGESSASPVLDQTEAEPAFTELAAERTRAVRRYLTAEKGVDAARVSECRPTFEAADQGRPRVDVSL